jgi:hypothetical protein
MMSHLWFIYHITAADSNNDTATQHFFELLGAPEKNGATGDLVLAMVGCDLVSSLNTTVVGTSDAACSPNADGYIVGGLVAVFIGPWDGSSDGLVETVTVGADVEGDAEGILVGSLDGVMDEGSLVTGNFVGSNVGNVVISARLGINDDIMVGIEEANVGDIEGSIEGI